MIFLIALLILSIAFLFTVWLKDAENIKTKARINSFWISLTYVSLGIISCWATFSDNVIDNYILNLFVALIMFATFPVYLLSIAVGWTYGNNYWILFITELIIFLIFWFIAYKFLLKRYKRSI